MSTSFQFQAAAAQCAKSLRTGPNSKRQGFWSKRQTCSILMKTWSLLSVYYLNNRPNWLKAGSKGGMGHAWIRAKNLWFDPKASWKSKINGGPRVTLVSRSAFTTCHPTAGTCIGYYYISIDINSVHMRILYRSGMQSGRCRRELLSWNEHRPLFWDLVKKKKLWNVVHHFLEIHWYCCVWIPWPLWWISTQKYNFFG